MASWLLALSGVLASSSAAARTAPVDEAGGTPVVSPAQDAVWRLLLPRVATTSLDVDSIAGRIARLGTGTAETLVGILTGEVGEPDYEYPIRPDAIERRGEILRAALRLLPRAEAVAALTRRARAGADVDRSILVVHWLAEVGGSEALRGALAVAASLEPIQHQRAYVQQPIEQALRSFVAEDGSNVRLIGKALDQGPLALAPLLVRVIAASSSPAAGSILVRNLRRAPELDLEIVRGLGSCAGAGGGAFEESGFAFLRDALSSDLGEIRRAAVAALSRLGDAASAPRLVELLRHDDPLTVVAARQGLETLSGKRLGASASAWETWLAAEEAWFDSRLEDLAALSTDPEPAHVSDALAEVDRHPLFRHDVAEMWKPNLASEDAARRALFAELLGALGSQRAVPWLVRLLSDEDPAVRTRAHASLRQLTGLERPADPAAWNSLIQG